MKKILVAVFTMVAGVALRAEVPLVPAYTEPVLEISVDSDTTLDQWLSDNGKTLDGVKTIVKKGTGKLKSVSSISSYEGDVVVEGGMFSIGVTGALGGDAGIVYVLDGATLSWEPNNDAKDDVNFNFANKHLVISGRGYGAKGTSSDIGALYRPIATHWMKTAIGPCHLADDALIVAKGWEQDMYFGQAVYLNGKTLVLHHANSGKFWQMTGNTINGPGAIDVELGCFYPSGITFANETSDPFELVIEDGQTMRFWGGAGNSEKCTLVLKPGALMQGAGNIGEQVKYNEWKGKTVVEGTTVVTAYSSSWVDSVNLLGPVTGAFGFNAATTDKKGNFYLKLHNSENDFAGGVSMNGGYVDLYADGAAPANGGAVVLTNSSLRCFADVGWSLPSVEASGACGVRTLDPGQMSVWGGLGEETYVWTYGSVKDAVVKDGENELVYDSLYGAPLLDVRGGGVRFAFSQTHYGPAGLYAGFHIGETDTEYQSVVANQTSFYTDDTSWRRADVGGDARQAGSTQNASNFMPHVSRSYEIGFKLPDNASYGWGQSPKRSMWTYEGYIWNRTGVDQTWSILAHTGCDFWFYLDGVKIAGGNVNQIATNDTVRVSPGAHKVYYMQYTSNGWGGGNGSVKSWPMYTLGPVAIDFQGRGTHDYTDYVALADPGDGSVLTLTDDPAQLPKKVPSFDAMRFAQGTYLDAGNNDVTVPALTGYPEIRNGNLTVTESFNLEAAMDVGCASVDGTLTFADGCAFSVDDTKALRKKFRDAGKSFPCVIAEADEVVGCPKSTDKQWALNVSADGKKLLLEYRSKGLTVIVR